MTQDVLNLNIYKVKMKIKEYNIHTYGQKDMDHVWKVCGTYLDMASQIHFAYFVNMICMTHISNVLII